MIMSNPEIDNYGNQLWFNEKRQLHRLNGPAAEYANGDKIWYQHGKCHRLDGPAFELACGYKSWILYDKKHREDGPAIEFPDGNRQWWIDDKQINVNSQEEFERYMRLKAFW